MGRFVCMKESLLDHQCCKREIILFNNIQYSQYLIFNKVQRVLVFYVITWTIHQRIILIIATYLSIDWFLFRKLTKRRRLVDATWCTATKLKWINYAHLAIYIVFFIFSFRTSLVNILAITCKCLISFQECNCMNFVSSIFFPRICIPFLSIVWNKI